MRGRAPLFILVLVACPLTDSLPPASSALVPAVGQDGAKFIGCATLTSTRPGVR